MIKVLKAANELYAKKFSIMTELEKQNHAESIAETRERYRPAIMAGALGTWNSAKSNLKQALNQVQNEKKKILNSFDASKLANEMQVATMRIQNATKSDAGGFDMPAIEAIRNEAKLSGDPHKIKAVNEALTSLVSMVPEGAQDKHGNDLKFQANRMAFQAKRDLEAMHTSEGLVKADKVAADAVGQLNSAKYKLLDVAETFGEITGDVVHNTDIENAIKSVKQSKDGAFIIDETE